MRHLAPNPTHKLYSNSGNRALLELVDSSALAILDVGCGTGDNAALLKKRNPATKVWGISGSEAEARIARERLDSCWIADLESGLPEDALAHRYDTVLFSHVLEHLRDPAEIVRQASALMLDGGSCIVAVPNVLAWAQRAKFVVGRFEYAPSGVMDDTHLRFFTYDTAARYLLAKAPGLRLTDRRVTGSVPLWLLRRYVLSRSISGWLDDAGCRLLPNLFGAEVLLKAIKRGGEPGIS